MMKRTCVLLVIVVLMLCFVGCAGEVTSNEVSQNGATVKETYESGYKTYYEMSDGTWMFDGYTYQYRLEINGRMPSAPKDSTFVYLSNVADISFKRAYMAAGFSSDTNDYFSMDEAVLVEMY